MRIDWKGIVPALSTPTDNQGEVDENSMRSQIKFNIESGVHGLAACINAGEFYKFSDMERMRVAETVVDEANGKIPVLIGNTHSGTEPAAMHGKHAEDIGADGIILMPPIVNNLQTSLALLDHYTVVANKVNLPIMIQDGESKYGIHMCPTTMQWLVEEFSNMVSIKLEGPGSLAKMKTVIDLVGTDVAVFGGMAASQMLQELDMGAIGNIPDSCLTDLLVQIYDDHLAGNSENVENIYRKYMIWLTFLRRYGNPGSSAEIEKETLRLRGIIKSSQTRLPKVPLEEDIKLKLKEKLSLMGII